LRGSEEHRMKRLIALVITVAALPLAAQQLAQQAAQSAAPAIMAAKPSSAKIVATINGENITQEKLDALYARLGAQMRDQYDKNGGKQAFLENYLRKRLMVQEALKVGFDKRP